MLSSNVSSSARGDTGLSIDCVRCATQDRSWALLSRINDRFRQLGWQDPLLPLNFTNFGSPVLLGSNRLSFIRS